MSVPNKSFDKNKRFVGVKANEYVSKAHSNQANQSAGRAQGWANLGKINGRRVPPPANVPSLKSETGVNPPAFDPTTTHGWTSNENQPAAQNIVPNPTQQQIDALPVNSPTSQPIPLMDINKSRTAPTWNTATANVPTNLNEHIPSLLPLNDFPRLATQDGKCQPEPIGNSPNTSFRPANLATWKEGGSGRIQPLFNDMPQMMSANPGANMYQQPISNPNMRVYQSQMWTYNAYPSVPLPIHHQQQMKPLQEYKSPTILKNKDIDDLSKLTDNTWANSSQEVNYEERIRFSDDDDNNDHVELLNTNKKSHRINKNALPHSRLIQEDQHLKLMQDNKNSELMNALTVAKQRRDEQERNLKNEQQSIANTDEQKPVPGYQTRPLLASNDQENMSSSTSWQANKDTSTLSRVRHDTANSQSSFAMKSWSDQMDSYNHSLLPDKSRGNTDNDDSPVLNRQSRSQSESSSRSQNKNDSMARKSKKYPISSKKQQKPNTIRATNSSKKSFKHYPESQISPLLNSNDQWNNWEELADDCYKQHSPNENNSIQKSSHYNNKPSSGKPRGPNERQQINAHIKANSSSLSSKDNKAQATRHALPSNRPSESVDQPAKDSMTHKSQQRTNLNDHKQRYQTAVTPLLDTSSIPPLMSLRSDATTHQYKTSTFDNDSMHYNTSLDMHSNYHQPNISSRRHTALGSYGRYKRGGTHRHASSYSMYNTNNTSGALSAPSTSSGTRQKRNTTNRTNNVNNKATTAVEDASSSTKPVEKQVAPSTAQLPTGETEKLNDTVATPTSLKTEHETNVVSQIENDPTSAYKSNATIKASNSKKKSNEHPQSQPVYRNRTNYSHTEQEYEPMHMTTAHNYYGVNRRRAHHNPHAFDISSVYYYEQPKQHYNNTNRHNYVNESYQQQQQQQSKNRNSKRGNRTTIANSRQQAINGNNNNFRHHSTSDNDQKEGEEWETASESSTNMRNGHYDTNTINNEQINEAKSMHRGKTPTKKTVSNQRHNARQIFKYTNA